MDFYDTLPRRATFEAMADPASYTALPDDWVVGCADIVGSTKEIAAGRYKTVNMVGAAVISAQINAAQGRAFPYVFGGDGAAFACAPDQAATAAAQLSAVQAWARAEFGITLRTAMATMAQVRAAGRDVSVARYQASRDVDYAMFAGGGLAWVEAQMKAGAFALPEAPEARPDLSGLSCRWSHIRAQHGIILSLVIEPAGRLPGVAFARLAAEVLDIARGLERNGHPIPVEGASVRWPPPGVSLEAQASHGDNPVGKRRLWLYLETLFAWAVLRFNIPVGGFSPQHYKQTVGRNADYRKFDDGLKMTLDCDAATVARLRALLDRAEAEGVIRYGLHEQDEAMMTCFVPSTMTDDHVHFIDGASGGYALAAARIKAETH